MPEPKVSCRGKQTAAPKLPASKKRGGKISQYCLCCALNSNVKQAPPAPPDGGLHLHSGHSANTSGGAPGAAGTPGPRGGGGGALRFYLAPTLSFCLQGHSCLVGGSHCHVWHPTRGARPPHFAAAPDFPAKGSSRPAVKSCSSARTMQGGGGGGGLQAEVLPHLPYQRAF